MLQAFLDASGTEGPALVLAGFIAKVPAWESFSDEWWEALTQMDPPIEYFKMSEAAYLVDQFCGWSERRRDIRVGRLYRIIENHTQASLSAALPLAAYR